MAVKLPFFVIRDHIPIGGLRGANDLQNMLYVGFALGEAVTLTYGGSERWRGEQFSVAREMPWSPYSWALLIALSAVVMGIGVAMKDSPEDDPKTGWRGVLIVAGALGCATWCAFYAYCLWLAGQHYPDEVSFNGPYVWACFCAWYMIKIGQHLEFRLVGGRSP